MPAARRFLTRGCNLLIFLEPASMDRFTISHCFLALRMLCQLDPNAVSMIARSYRETFVFRNS
jgi:hypothetical protein